MSELQAYLNLQAENDSLKNVVRNQTRVIQNHQKEFQELQAAYVSVRDQLNQLKDVIMTLNHPQTPVANEGSGQPIMEARKVQAQQAVSGQSFPFENGDQLHAFIIDETSRTARDILNQALKR